MQRVEHEVLAFVGTRVARDLFAGPGDYHFMDVTADQHLAMTKRGRHRVVVAAITHQRQRANPRRLLFARLIGNPGQRQEGLAVADQPLADGVIVTAEPIVQTTSAVLE